MRSIALLLLLQLYGCTVLHKAQIGEIDMRGSSVSPIDIKVSEMGFSVKEAGKLGAALAKNKKSSDTVKKIANIIALFQMGPTTGKPVYNDTYARNIRKQIIKSCPSGYVTGLSSIRETTSYPVISGEIVKITGYCITRKGRRKK